MGLSRCKAIISGERNVFSYEAAGTFKAGMLAVLEEKLSREVKATQSAQLAASPNKLVSVKSKSLINI